MQVFIEPAKEQMGRLAARHAAELIRAAIAARGSAAIILATGTSQYEMLRNLAAAPDVDWSRVSMFHLDEYIGLPASHPASFRRYLAERFVSLVPPLRAVHFIEADARDPRDPASWRAECRRIGGIIASRTIDAAMIGIGENGHIAFNDPPADFDTDEPFIVVDLDEACRRQQVGEGWFRSLDDVPRQAISMSIRQIMKSRSIAVTVPDARKAPAVAAALCGPVTSQVPASILQLHLDCRVFLDAEAASLLSSGSECEDE